MTRSGQTSETAEPPQTGGGDQGIRILEAAREIIRETGALDLPMRVLSARAKVSMTRPYALFGSKSGVVAAILAMDEVRWTRERAAVRSADLIEEHFDSLRLGMNFYASDQAFYRALFRMSWDQAEGGRDPTRLNHSVFLRRMREAHREGLLRAGTAPDAVAEVLTDLFTAGVRAWAMLGWDVERLYAKLGFGYAVTLAGVGATPVEARMQQRALVFQELLEPWSAGSAG